MSKQKNRQAVLDELRRSQKSSQKRQTLVTVAVSVTVAVLIIGAAAYKPVSDWWSMRDYETTALGDLGAPASVCSDVTTKPAVGQQDHVPVGTPLEFEDAPPAFGRHYERWARMDRTFYTSDRPELGELVHNLEHGFTILWYDETIAADDEQLDLVRGIAAKFDDNTDLRNKFKAVPWTEEDGDPFPEGQHVALTHWSVGGTGNLDPEAQVGVWQYCSEPSGAALDRFMKDYPYSDSPEPNAV